MEDKIEKLKKAGEKDMYKDYEKTTTGTDKKNYISFRQETNPTKSKYDNVVAFLR